MWRKPDLARLLAPPPITPYNHSPSTPRGKELVEKARVLSPSLITPRVASVPTRSSSSSRVRTFMQGRTRPEPVLCDTTPPPSESSSLRFRKASSLTLGMPASLQGSPTTPSSSSSPSDAADVMDAARAVRAVTGSPSLTRQSVGPQVVARVVASCPPRGEQAPVLPGPRPDGASDGPLRVASPI
jgi:hypothetical protein